MLISAASEATGAVLPATPSTECAMLLEMDCDRHHQRLDAISFACRIELMPDLTCYPELQVLELQHNKVAGIVSQTGLRTLVALDLSDNRLQNFSAFQSLHLLVSLTRLDMSGNSLELDSRQSPHP